MTRQLDDAYIPYGAYWSSPFCRWQGALAGEHALRLAASSAAAALARRSISAEQLDGIVLGTTVMQRQGFYAGPWVAALLGAPSITGPTIGQACATSARVLASAAASVQLGERECALAITCDRTSNGPHVVYPNPRGIGGTGEHEDPVVDSFGLDPHGGTSMLVTAENVAREAGIGREELDQMALLRYQQYCDALADDRAFQRRYMLPIEVRRGKQTATIDADEGVHATTAEGLAGLRPVVEGGVVTYGTQTHPADGNAGAIVCTADRARELSADPAVTIRVIAFGEARVAKARMPTAVVPAARRALERAGIDAAACRAIKTHNPFAVNDVYLCRELDLAPERVNRFGSSLVYGHPQAPTGLRAIVELIEELVLAGGGHGLFTGCAAGDTAMAVVLQVG